ncbi:MAG: rRNA maturation RNase YbeY [Rhizobiales bacterium]|nr:rRNA maturation RNase YbeY [Hyphomicrobiales bacterium]
MDAGGLALEIDVSPDAASLDANLPAVIASAVSAANEIGGPEEGALTVVVDDDERIRALNKLWRGVDKPTNVLSFPSADTQPGPATYLGDIAISYETAAREAATEDKSLADHIAHLAVHGFLHLVGYDHESDQEAEEMEGLERVILARLGVSDPYIVHSAEG